MEIIFHNNYINKSIFEKMFKKRFY